MIKKFFFLGFIMSIAVFADSRAVYGTDDRIDVGNLYTINNSHAEKALKSTCLIIKKGYVYKSDKDNDHYYILVDNDTKTIKDFIIDLMRSRYGLNFSTNLINFEHISEEKLNSIKSVGATGFLVAKNVIATAGHVGFGDEPDEYTCIFGYHNFNTFPSDEENSLIHMNHFRGVSADNWGNNEDDNYKDWHDQYFIKVQSNAQIANVTSTILEGNYDETSEEPFLNKDNDYKLFQIDNIDLPYLEVARYSSGAVFNLSHGHGQPMKYGTGEIKDYKSIIDYGMIPDQNGAPECIILHTLDTDPSSSGSPIIDNISGDVVGIHTGATGFNKNYDYIGYHDPNDPSKSRISKYFYQVEWYGEYSIYENALTNGDGEYNTGIAISKNPTLYGEINRILAEEDAEPDDDVVITGKRNYEYKGIEYESDKVYKVGDGDIRSNGSFGTRGFFQNPDNEVSIPGRSQSVIKYVWNYNNLQALGMKYLHWSETYDMWSDEVIDLDQIYFYWGDGSESRYNDNEHEKDFSFSHTYPDNVIKTYTIQIHYKKRTWKGYETKDWEYRYFTCYPKRLIHDNPYIGIPAVLF